MARTRHSISKAVTKCLQASGRACWLTEWGVRTHSSGCSLDSGRGARLEAIDIELERLQSEGALRGAFYFNLSNNRELSLYRCGRLDSGAPNLFESVFRPRI